MASEYDPRSFAALTFHDAVPAFRDGSDTPRDYLERCLETISEREPVVKAWVTLNEEGARKAADESTGRYKAGRALSSIDGMPLGIKDLLMTKDMPTKMGSPLYEDNFPKQDNPCVMALREAGAVVLGKTVTTELGMSHPGPTTNPFNEKHTPGGSSSGSSAVIGARMVPAAIGTQVVGSIIRPAAFCANYAIKPTMGALHRGERQAFSQSHTGVHAGSLEDMWRVAIEVAKRSGGDPGYVGLVGSDDVRGAARPARLIVIEAEGWAQVGDETRAAFEGLIGKLRDAGVEIVTRKDNPLVEAFEQSIADALALSRDVCAYELRWTLQNLLNQYGGGLSDSLMSRHEIGQKMTIEQYREILMLRENARRALAAVASAGDAMICPACIGPAPLKDNQEMDSGVLHTTGNPAYNTWTSLTGAPAITLPLLAVGGLPVGVQVVGQINGDHLLSGYAAWVRDTVLSGYAAWVRDTVLG